MRNKTKLAIACGAILLTAAICAAQSEGAKSAAEQPKYFHLDLAGKEMDSGKVSNARHYSTTIATGESTPYNCTIRTGSKVPVPNGGTIAAGQFTYIDVAVNIVSRSQKEVEETLPLGVPAKITSAPPRRTLR